MTDRPATTMVVEDRPYRELDDGLIGVYITLRRAGDHQIRTASRHAGGRRVTDGRQPRRLPMPIGGVAAYRGWSRLAWATTSAAA
jgi:hypothetical protein